MTTETHDIANALNPQEAIAALRKYRMDNEAALVPLAPLTGLAALSDVYHAIDSSTYNVVPGTMEFLAILGTELARAAKSQHSDIEKILYRASPEYRDRCLRSLELAERKRQSQAEGGS